MTVGICLALITVAAPFAVANHSGGNYEQPVWFTWGSATGTLDVVVVPPNHGQIFNGNGLFDGNAAKEVNPCQNSYMEAIRDSIQAFEDGVDEYGSSLLQARFDLNVFEYGCDTGVPPLNPEIVIVTDETKANILGVAVHPGLGRCIVDNSKFFVFSFNYADMFNINGQEFGHCLGLQHVGEPSDHPAKDVMDGSYDNTPGEADWRSELFCVSNLNVEGLENVFTTGKANGLVPVDEYAHIRAPPTPPSVNGGRLPCGNLYSVLVDCPSNSVSQGNSVLCDVTVDVPDSGSPSSWPAPANWDLECVVTGPSTSATNATCDLQDDGSGGESECDTSFSGDQTVDLRISTSTSPATTLGDHAVDVNLYSPSPSPSCSGERSTWDTTTVTVTT